MSHSAHEGFPSELKENTEHYAYGVTPNLKVLGQIYTPPEGLELLKTYADFRLAFSEIHEMLCEIHEKLPPREAAEGDEEVNAYYLETVAEFAEKSILPISANIELDTLRPKYCQPFPKNEGDNARIRRILRFHTEHYLQILSDKVYKMLAKVFQGEQDDVLLAAAAQPFHFVILLQDPSVRSALCAYFAQAIAALVQREVGEAEGPGRYAVAQAEEFLRDQMQTLLSLAKADAHLTPVVHVEPGQHAIVRPGQVAVIPSDGYTYVLYQAMSATLDQVVEVDKSTTVWTFPQYAKPAHRPDDVSVRTIQRDARAIAGNVNSFSRDEEVIPVGSALVLHIESEARALDGLTFEEATLRLGMYFPYPRAVRAFVMVETNVSKQCEGNKELFGYMPLESLQIPRAHIQVECADEDRLGMEWYLDLSQGRPAVVIKDLRKKHPEVVYLMPNHPIDV